MTSKVKISHSSKDTYTLCSEKYRLHYVEKLRSPKITSSLFFGNALDEAFSRLLLDKKVTELTESEKEMLKKSHIDIFMSKMTSTKSPLDYEVDVHIPLYKHADYYASDYEPDLLNKNNLEGIKVMSNGELSTLNDVKMFMDDCKDMKSKKVSLPEDDYILCNYITWTTLVEKGLLMLEAYKSQIIPKIHSVYSIQRKIEIENEHGDIISGLIDFEASFIDSPDVIYVCDNKSSKEAYPDDAVQESPQLATYCEAVGNTNASYVVVRKKIFKKQPIIHTQILKNTVKEETFKKTFDEFEKTVYDISAEKFEKNFDACFSFGKMCPYYTLCKHGNMGNLVKLKIKE